MNPLPKEPGPFDVLTWGDQFHPTCTYDKGTFESEIEAPPSFNDTHFEKEKEKRTTSLKLRIGQTIYQIFGTRKEDQKMDLGDFFEIVAKTDSLSPELKKKHQIRKEHITLEKLKFCLSEKNYREVNQKLEYRYYLSKKNFLRLKELIQRLIESKYLYVLEQIIFRKVFAIVESKPITTYWVECFSHFVEKNYDQLLANPSFTQGEQMICFDKMKEIAKKKAEELLERFSDEETNLRPFNCDDLIEEKEYAALVEKEGIATLEELNLFLKKQKAYFFTEEEVIPFLKVTQKPLNPPPFVPLFKRLARLEDFSSMQRLCVRRNVAVCFERGGRSIQWGRIDLPDKIFERFYQEFIRENFPHIREAYF